MKVPNKTCIITSDVWRGHYTLHLFSEGGTSSSNIALEELRINLKNGLLKGYHFMFHNLTDEEIDELFEGISLDDAYGILQPTLGDGPAPTPPKVDAEPDCRCNIMMGHDPSCPWIKWKNRQ